jgi:outer membrane protein assembly factor BamA
MQRITNSSCRFSTVSLVILFIVLFFCTGCNTTKYLSEDQSFYGGSRIKFKPVQKGIGGKGELEKDLEALITPKPNTKVFGVRPGVWFYFRQRDAKKKKGFKAWIRKKFGQAPVLITDVEPERTAMLTGQLQNDGYFKSDVEYVVKEKKKESIVIYTVKLYPPYRLKNINYPKGKDSTYARILRTLKKKSLLEPKQRYDLARLQAEQQRIETAVKNFGLYYFDDRYLIFEADSTVGEKQVDIDLKLEKGIPDRGRRIYTLNEINLYPDYTLNSDTVRLEAARVVVDSMNYYDYTQKFRPRVITRVVNLRKDNIYTRDDHDLTLSHLMDLGTFKFVNVRFEEVHPDSTLLNANIFLTPLKKKSLRAEFQAVSKSNNFVGPGLQVTFTNRNFLGGAELFQLKVNTSYEVQVSRRATNTLNSFELGVESSLTVPRFITPIRIDYSSKKFLPKTDFRVGVNVQNRVGFFRLNSLNIAAGYLWRESESKSHELFPIDINFVKTDNTSDVFDELLTNNTFLANSFDDQFIIGSRYSYTFNTQMKDDQVLEFEERRYRTHSFYFNGNVQIAGNAISGVQKLVDEETGEIFNTPYSQFVRGDVDFRYYWQFNLKSKLATRLVVGSGYAYGNSTALPYIKQFSIGGSNSIRAFPARSIGPGTYNIRDEEAVDPGTGEEVVRPPVFIDQRGDIKLEANAEYRFDIIKAFKGAVFVDAGNIWLWEEDDSRPGSGFKKENFLDEFAMGTGFGVRFDFSFFVLRFDLAFPIRKPYLPENDRWVFDRIDLGSSDWRKENLIFNIAIGYPF